MKDTYLGSTIADIPSVITGSQYLVKEHKFSLNF